MIYMKKTIIILCMLNLFQLFAQNFNEDGSIRNLTNLSYAEDLIHDIEFTENEILFRDFEKGIESEDDIIRREKYSLITENKLCYILLEESNEKWLCLANEGFIIIYNGEKKEPYIYGVNFKGMGEDINYPHIGSLSASSELKEGDKVYSAGNLANRNVDEPWVEDAKGNGIGESITLYTNGRYLYYLGGYVSYDKPYLYERNSRPKTIKISFLDDKSKEDMIVNLNDTPNPQKIDFGSRLTEKIKIEILDVYEGTKYQDTCINSFIFKIF